MSRRGIRGTSMRARLAVAAAVLVGGGAAGVVAVNASHSTPATATQSAGYYSQSNWRSMSYTSALSSAMGSWDQSQSRSLVTLSHMQPMTNYWTQSWHRSTIFLQRGTVIAVARGEFVVESANRTVEIWHVSGGTTVLNVGGSSTGMSAMTGGSMRVPSWWQMNTRVRGIARGDLVFVFGQKENHTLKAELVLFAAPMTTVRPTATPTSTVTVTPVPTVTVTATAPPAANGVTPTATPSSSVTTFSGTKS